MLASSLDSAKNGGGEGQRGGGADVGEGAVAKEMGYRRAKQQRKRVKDQMKYIPVCVHPCIESLPSRVAKLCTEREERNMHKFAV